MMRQRGWVVGMALGLLGTAMVASGYAETLQDMQYWTPVVLEVPVGKLKASLEVQPRLANDAQRLLTVQVKPSLSWEATQHLTLTGGYFWAPNYPPVGAPTNNVTTEERLWQQAVVTHPLTPRRERPLLLTHQARLEQRFLPGVDPVAWRARYLCRLTVPLGQSRWSWLLHDEIHVNLNAVPTVPGGLGQNRLFTGLRRPLSSQMMMEVGYMMQWINQPTGTPNQLNHALLTRLTMTLPNLRKRVIDHRYVTPKPQEETPAPLILD